MPISPSSVQRHKPTFQEITDLLDKLLVKAAKSALVGAPYLYVQAPFGSRDHEQAIISAYVAAGWFKVAYYAGQSLHQDSIHFFPFDPNPVPPAPIQALPLI